MKIKMNKGIFINYLELFFWIILSGIILFLADNIIWHIISIIILLFGSAKTVKFDLIHPFVWYSIFFGIYSIAYPIIYFFNVNRTYIYTKELMYTQWMALVIFLLIVSPSKVTYSNLKDIRKDNIMSKLLNILLSSIIIVTIMYLSRGTHTRKSELYAQKSLILDMGFKAVLVFLMIYAINITIDAIKNKKLNIKTVIYSFILIFLMFFFSGERDLILRFIVFTFYVYYIFLHNPKNEKKIWALSSVLMLSIPMLKKFKYFGLTGEIDKSNNTNLIIEIMGSEFSSASRNMQILLGDPSSKGLFKGHTILQDIIRSLKIDKLIGVESFSPVAWFNSHYFQAGRAGQGFTIVGEGYINLGYLGIVLIFIILGMLVKILYVNSSKGVYWFVIYILSIPIFIYSIRADLANILSQLLGQVFLIVLIVVTIEKILGKVSKKG